MSIESKDCCDCECDTICNKKNFCSELSDTNYNVQNYFSYFFVNLLTSIGVNSWVGIPGSNELFHYYAIYQSKINIHLSKNENNSGYVAIGASRYSNIKGNKRELIGVFLDQGPGIASCMNPAISAMTDNVPILLVSIFASEKKIKNRIIQDVNPELFIKTISKSYYEITVDDINDKSVVEKLYYAIKKGFSYPQGPITIIYGNGAVSADATELLKYLKDYQEIFKNMFVSEYGLKLKDNINSPDYITGLFAPGWEKTRFDFIVNNYSKIIQPENYQTFFSNILKKSHKPLFLIGVGCYNYIEEVINFCKKINCPYLCTLYLAGFSNKEDPFCAIRMGHTSTYTGNNMANETDCVIIAGTSFNNYTLLTFNNPFPEKAVRIAINLYPELYDTSNLINYYIIDSIENVINNLNPEQLLPDFSRKEWFRYLNDLKIQEKINNSIYYNKDPDLPLLPGDMYDILQKYFDLYTEENKKTNITFYTDTGTSQPYTASLFKFNKKRYRIFTSYKFASIGSGLGTIIGMATYYPNDIFVLIAGDAATLWSVQEILSLKENNIKNVIIIVVENYGIGLIEEESIDDFDRKLQYANGYKYFADWKNLMKGLLLDTNIAKTKNEFEYYLSKGLKNLFKECFCIIAFFPYTSPYSPLVKLNEPLTDFIYVKPDPYNKIDFCRLKNL